ncbi:hypothetical protein BV898_01931 [Hypsibius exemplaris]|uniref:Uncharacterized protein n=1 Tax=Hypsibius exemplaris TaxID=2072580 RepID=A0A1W0XA45_HYPEX|nr:hypothetical protein BV898_01931 [Hypsibius exemplaris]
MARHASNGPTLMLSFLRQVALAFASSYVMTFLEMSARTPELVIRENHGDVLPTIEQMLKIQASTTAASSISSAAAQMNNTQQAHAASYLQRNPLFLAVLPALEYGRRDAVGLLTVSMMNAAAAAAAAAAGNGMPAFPSAPPIRRREELQSRSHGLPPTSGSDRPVGLDYFLHRGGYRHARG